MRSQHVHVLCMLLPDAAERLKVILFLRACDSAVVLWQLAHDAVFAAILQRRSSATRTILFQLWYICPAHPIATTPHLSRIRCGSVHKSHDIMEM